MKRSGYVYFVYNAGLVKIGCTKDFKKRFRQFKTTMPFARVLQVERVCDMFQIEKYYHELYKRYRVRGEWFKLPLGGGSWA